MKKSKMTTIRDAYSIPSNVVAKDFICGTELEIEALNPSVNHNYANFNTTTDGSLRNNGCEFVSLPLCKKDSVFSFRNLHKLIKYGNGDPFTERTSIHVHVNCLDLGLDQAKSLVLWYSLFEPVFFGFCAKKRSNNIFCVPVEQTVLPNHYSKPFKAIVTKWSKYTAFNILPISTQGTMEFRHMHGHNDVELYEEWLTALENWWKWGQENVPSKLTLKKESFIKDAFDAIFKDTRMHNIGMNVHTLVENNLIDLKLALL